MRSSKCGIYFHVYKAMQWKVGNQLNENLTMMLGDLIQSNKSHKVFTQVYIATSLGPAGMYLQVLMQMVCSNL